MKHRWRTLTRQGAAWAWALAAALLFAQGLGQLHRVQHAAGLHAEAAAGAAEGHGHFDGHAAGDGQCRLLDALAAADLLPGLPGSVPPLPPAQPPRVASVPAGVAAPGQSPYEARAPPRG